MRELIYDNVRIQFLSEEVLRLEVRYGAYFTDRNTLWIPDRGVFEKAGKRLPESQSRYRENQGRQQSLVVREEAAQEHSRPQRFLLPEKNCSTSEKKKIYPAMGCGGSLSSGVQKRCKKAPGNVCLSDRKGRYAPGGCIGGSKN